MESSSILVVDDSKDFLFLLSSLLKFHKFSMDSAANAAEALKLCQDKKYALIISDYIMDDMDGLTMCKAIRHNGLNQDAPIILITAKNLEESELQTLASLSLTYIKKPVMPNELYRKITDMLGRTP
jgi:CheY-like chemotaxis protein